MTAFLLIGLGNPGKSYAGNRHNIGFMAVDAIAEAYGFSKWSKKFQGLISEGNITSAKALLLKPQTYMNLSGGPGSEAARFYKIPIDHIIVIHDDLDIDFGFAKLKRSGGNAGHNGLRSLDEHLGKDYWRMRIGIGRPQYTFIPPSELITNHVLSDFSKKEKADLPMILSNVVKNIIPMVKQMKETGAKNLKINLLNTQINIKASASNMDPGLRRDDT